MILNERLALEQGVTEEQRKELSFIYKEIEYLFEEERNSTHIHITGRQYADKLKLLEFRLQKNWNFPQNELFHTWWNRFVNCKCPKIDNLERFGYPKIISCDCPIHKHLCDTNTPQD